MRKESGLEVSIDRISPKVQGDRIRFFSVAKFISLGQTLQFKISICKPISCCGLLGKIVISIMIGIRATLRREMRI